jgi:aldehyde dehydrogenase (NAD+)
MGKALAPLVADRLGRSLLELGGNNGMVVGPSADLDLAVRAVVFSAVGTAGQRCTSLRRLIVQESIADELWGRLERAYATVPVGDPRETGTLCGPLISEDAYLRQQAALARARADGGLLSGGERVLADEHPRAFYVRPALVRMPSQTEVVRDETFAPVLYVLTYRDLDEAVALHNGVPHGLSS